MRFRTFIVVPLVAAGVLACAHPLSPVPDEKNDVLQYVLVAPVPLSQAILAAEERTVGKAIRAELVRQDGTMTYQVLVTAQGRLHLVGVDPVTGKVSAVRLVSAEHGGD